MKVNELKKLLEDYNDDNYIVVEIHEGVRHEDLYNFTIDVIDYVKQPDGTFGNEIRLCI